MPAGARSRRLAGLPARPTPLIGRQQETAAACDLLRRPDVRLLTLTGPPGVGKTRLAVEVAASLSDGSDHETIFVNLAPITDPAQVLPAIAQAHGLRETGNSPLSEIVAQHLATRPVLLVLDNFEQVLAAGPQVGDLLAASQNVKALATSRERLNLTWEHEFPVPPLDTPDLTRLPALDALVAFPAVALFLERARASKPDFRLTPLNGRAIAEICVRLDGLPLALELAAARIKHLPPLAMLVRLENRVAVLNRGPADLIPRHKTLREAIRWSYDLLSVSEQAMFRRLAVFAGGCTPEAAGAVGAPDGQTAADTLAILASLVDKNLIIQDEGADGEVRFRLLETIRDYGLEMLAATGELEEVRGRHVTYFVDLAERSNLVRRGTVQDCWPRRFASERENLRAAFETLRRRGDWTTAVQFAGALGWYWRQMCHYDEGSQYLQETIARGGVAPAASRARALVVAGHLEYNTGYYTRALPLLEQALTLYKTIDDRRGVARVLRLLGFIELLSGGMDQAVAMMEESVSLYREAGDKFELSDSLEGLAHVLAGQQLHARSRGLLLEALALRRAGNDRWGTAETLTGLGEAAYREGDPDGARRCFEEALAFSTDAGFDRGTSRASLGLGYILLSDGDHARAMAHFERALLVGRRLGSKISTMRALTGLGLAATHRGQYATARARFEEALPVAMLLEAEVKGRRAAVISLQVELGRLARHEHDLLRSAALLRDASDQARAAGDQGVVASALRELGATLQAQGDFGAALSRYGEGLHLTLKHGIAAETADCLAWLVTLPWRGDQAIRAARLHGAADMLRRGRTPARPPADRAIFKRAVAHLRSHLGERAFQAARAAGQRLSADQAVAEAMTLAGAGPPIPDEPATSREPSPLTARELGVARLIAQGLSNREIAAALVITEGTTENHVQHILNKLGFNSRAQIAAWVSERGARSTSETSH